MIPLPFVPLQHLSTEAFRTIRFINQGSNTLSTDLRPLSEKV